MSYQFVIASKQQKQFNLIDLHQITTSVERVTHLKFKLVQKIIYWQIKYS